MNQEINTFNPTTVGSNWSLGGHLSSGDLHCTSCHGIHQSDAKITGAALILGDSITDFCYACHGGGPSTPAGPGGVPVAVPDVPTGSGLTQENPGDTAYYHPVNSEPLNGYVSMGFNAG